MSHAQAPLDDARVAERFPRAAGYNPAWVLSAVSGGANALWITEWLSEALDLRPGMRVLDLGCGRATSSIFLHREFGVEVWAADLWFSATENRRRIEDAGASAGVFPVHADGRSLPFAHGFFDAIVSIDAFPYVGTDDLYLGSLLRFLKPGGTLAIAGAGLVQELDGAVPAHLQAWWTPDLWCLHSAAWWRRHWERTGFVDILCADDLAEGWRYWRRWIAMVAPDNADELGALDADAGRCLGYVRVAARRRADAAVPDLLTTVPTEYAKTPLLAPDRTDR